MSLAEIEAELEKLAPGELRRVALESWRVSVEKGSRSELVNECCEDDPELLAALDQAIEKAEAASNEGYSGTEPRIGR